MATVLVIDPAETENRRLVPVLLEDGHSVHVVRTGAGGLKTARAQQPDAVVLVSTLPDISATEVCSSLKEDPATRSACVVYVSQKGTEAERVAGLELGADDVVVEPFSARELVLRIRALLRRRTPRGPGPAPAQLLAIDTGAHRVLVHGRDVHVTALELRLLCALREAGGRIQSRQALLRSVWGDERGVSTRTVDTHIKRLRRKLGPAAICIRSVRGKGYGFEAAALETPSVARASRPPSTRPAEVATAART